MKITKDTLKLFREDFKKAMQPLNEKYNLDIQLENIKFTDTQFYSKLVANNKDEEAVKATQDELNMHFKLSGLPFKYGDILKYNGSTYKIVDINSRARKAPIVLQNIETGRKASCSVEFAKHFDTNLEKTKSGR